MSILFKLASRVTPYIATEVDQDNGIEMLPAPLEPILRRPHHKRGMLNKIQADIYPDIHYSAQKHHTARRFK